MEKLSGVRVSGEWARAVLACVDEAPAASRRSRLAWALGGLVVLCVLAGSAGVVAWFGW